MVVYKNVEWIRIREKAPAEPEAQACSLWWMVFYNGMGLKLIKNIDTQWALSKQRNFLGTKQATAKLGGEAGTASPAEPEAQAIQLVVDGFIMA